MACPCGVLRLLPGFGVLLRRELRQRAGVAFGFWNAGTTSVAQIGHDARGVCQLVCMTLCIASPVPTVGVCMGSTRARTKPSRFTVKTGGAWSRIERDNSSRLQNRSQRQSATIGSAEVIGNLTPSGVKPEGEWQIRPLTNLPPD